MNLAECFDDIHDYQLYYANKEIDGERLKYYEIVFDKPEMKNQFLESNKDKALSIIDENETGILIQYKF